MCKTIAMVQARMGSHRFPGKSLTPLWNGVTLIELVLKRVMRAARLDQVVLAASNHSIDDALSHLGDDLNVPVFRGDEQDVLKRFCDAAEVFPTEAIVRVCGDNPLVDPLEIDRLVEFYWASQPCDYACNDRLDCGLPDGAGAEIFSYSTLLNLNDIVADDLREHVSLYVTHHPKEFNVARLEAKPHLNRPDIRLDVDYWEDAEFVRQLIDHLDPTSAPYWSTAEIIDALDQNPHLFDLRKNLGTLTASKHG